MKSKPKRTRFHQAWRVKNDYRSKLTDEQAAYLDKFDAEFHRGEFSEDDPLHNPEQQRQITSDLNHGWTDIVTQTDDKVAEHLAKPVSKFCPHDYYSPDEYRANAINPEEALVEAIDLDKAAAKKPV